MVHTKIKCHKHFGYAEFPLSRSAPRLESWSLSLTNRGSRISSYQTLISIVGDLERHNEVGSHSGCIYIYIYITEGKKFSNIL